MKGRIWIAIACAGVLATSAGSARAQTTFRETGSVTVGGYVVWVRGTNASAVELFVGRGFRDAFAPAHEMDAVKLQHWIDSVRTLVPVAADDSSALSATAKATVGGDVSMQRRVGGTFAGLRLLVSGEEPIQMAEPTARDFILALDSAARVARELSAPAVQTVATTATTVKATTTTVTTVSPPAMTTASAPEPVAVAAAPMPAPTPTPAPKLRTMTAPSPSAPDAPATAALPVTTLAASTSEPAPELVLPAPAAPVLLLASRVDIMPLPMPPVIPPARVRAPVMIAKVDSAPAPAPVAVAAPVATPPVATPPVVAPPVATQPVPAAAPAPVVADTAVAPHPEPPADKLIHTPLGPFTIPAALLSDRDKEAQYCYTQLGLKYNPDLKGEITIKLSLAADGTVQDAVVSKRSWQGISAGEVESCVRALAHDWTFASTDAGVTDGAKLLTFSFAP